MGVLLGTSGWQYRDWRGPYYPAGLAQARWLEHYAAGFATVEINNTFYRLPKPETFAKWSQTTPDDFVITVKASRYLTHIKRLRQPEEPVARLLAGLEELGSKLGPVLLQLPPDMRADVELLGATLAEFPAGIRLAVEPRHPSWFTDDLYRALEARDAALVLADRGSRPITPVRATASWGYLRLHEGRSSHPPCYGRAALHSWVERLAQLWPPERDADLFVYFNNDPGACAVRDAQRFGRAARAAGLDVTRIPAKAVSPDR
jgi:uncharacterized protein YecE (DUF72 family)